MPAPRAVVRRAMAQAYRETGTLWGNGDEAEAETIRDWVELIAEIPMGYGRVGRVPTSLDIDELDVSPHYAR